MIWSASLNKAPTEPASHSLPSSPNHVYQVSYKNSIEDPSWSSAAQVTATGGVTGVDRCDSGNSCRPLLCRRSAELSPEKASRTAPRAKRFTLAVAVGTGNDSLPI